MADFGGQALRKVGARLQQASLRGTTCAFPQRIFASKFCMRRSFAYGSPLSQAEQEQVQREKKPKCERSPAPTIKAQAWSHQGAAAQHPAAGRLEPGLRWALHCSSRSAGCLGFLSAWFHTGLLMLLAKALSEKTPMHLIQPCKPIDLSSRAILKTACSDCASTSPEH